MKALLFTICLLSTSVTYAALEIRIASGTSEHDADSLNKGPSLSWSNALFMSESEVIGGDILYSFLEGRVPVGFRYEELEEDVSGFGNTRAFAQDRVIFMAGYRPLLGKHGYLGINVGAPISAESAYAEVTTTPSVFAAESDNLRGYFASIDAAYLNMNYHFTVGVEYGMNFYEVAKWEEVNNPGFNTQYGGQRMKMELEGSFMKGYIGFFY